MIYITLALGSIAVTAFAAMVIYEWGYEAGGKVAMVFEHPRPDQPALNVTGRAVFETTVQQFEQVMVVPELQPKPLKLPAQETAFLRACAEWNEKLLHVPLVKLTPIASRETKQ